MATRALRLARMASSRTPGGASATSFAPVSAANATALDNRQARLAARIRRVFDKVAPFSRVRVRRFGLLRDPGDLRALDSHAGHQALLAEDEGIDVLRERRAGDRLGESRIDHDDARSDAELEALALVEIGERAVVHEEE